MTPPSKIYQHIFSIFSIVLFIFACPSSAKSDWADSPKNPRVNENYYRLKKALNYYESLTTRPWPTITSFHVSKDSSSPAVSELRERLRLTGDLSSAKDSQSERFDESLYLAIKNFQWRHGLKPDGIVGSRTLRELNVSPFERAEEIRRNMQRWAALPAYLGKRFIFINIPEYRLDLVQDATSVLHMKIIVGKPDRPTPELSSILTQVELNPYWNIPPFMAKNDILPKILKDPHYLQRTHIKVVQHQRGGVVELDPSKIDWQNAYDNDLNYEFRQEPGKTNALGLIKFDFSNPYAVYMHDTPAKELFSRNKRTFSSGCIRIEKPFALLSYLLKGDPVWDLHHVAQALQSGKLTKIKVAPLPIYVIYATAWVDRQGILHFRRDPYHYNEDPNLDDDEPQAMINNPFAIPLSFYA